MPRFGLNGATTGEQVDLRTDIRVAADAGYQDVELRDAKIVEFLAGGGTLEELAGLLRSRELQAASLNALEDSTLRTGEGLEATLARCRTLCGWAAAIGSPYVISVPSFLPEEGLPEEEVRARTVASLRAMAEVAGEFGVRVGFEFLGFATCSVSTLRAARRIVDEVEDPRVGLVIDTFHFYAGGSRIEDLDGLDPSRIFVVHVDDAEPGDPAGLGDAQRLLPGEGVIPLRALVGRLEEIGYRGTYSLELFRPEYWRWNPEELARRGLESLRGLFA